jgi:hypothetical protein
LVVAAAVVAMPTRYVRLSSAEIGSEIRARYVVKVFTRSPYETRYVTSGRTGRRRPLSKSAYHATVLRETLGRDWWRRYGRRLPFMEGRGPWRNRDWHFRDEGPHILFAGCWDWITD